MSRGALEQGVVGSFAHLDELLAAVRGERPDGVEVLDVFSPVPVEGVAEHLAPRPSPVRWFTFVGGLAGMIGGFALGIGSALIWNIVVGGKPVASHVPFVVIAFEGLILLGAIFTFLGILVAARLPYRKFPGPAHQPQFTEDRFGVWLGCAPERVAAARGYLERHGAESVLPVGGEGAR
jgi:molybdopterin-containing oxidoreductase family membrane subunit